VIGILWSMIRGRWARAIAVCALASATIAIVAAWPAYLARADASMIATEIAHASTSEVTTSARQVISVNVGIAAPSGPDASGDGGSSDTSSPPPDTTADTDFVPTETTRLTAPWFTTIYATDIDVDTASVAPGASEQATIPLVLFRQNYCAHVVITSGRCPVALREVLLDDDLAMRLHASIGAALNLYGVKQTSLAEQRSKGVGLWQALPAYVAVTVVGTYRVPDRDDAYWGTEAYFSTASGDRGDVLPILTQPGTIDVLPHSERRENVDAELRTSAVTVAALPAIRSQVHPFNTSIPAMLDRVDADRSALRVVVPLVAVPLLLLGCFVLFLAAGQAADVRRPELAVIKLRGLAAWDRWWLAVAESVLAVAIAVPVGLAVGGPLARGVAAITLPSPAPATTTGASAHGELAWVAVLLLAVLGAHLRPLVARVPDLLRHVPDRARQWRSVPLQAAIIVLAVAAVAQLRAQTGPPAGLTSVAPALVVAAVAVVLGRLVPPITTRVGLRAIGSVGRRAGSARRLGTGLGAIVLARRPGAQRLVMVEAVAIGMLGFAFAASVAASQDRATVVALDLGAHRVLSVGSTSPTQLLRAVGAADPSGRYAMAAMAVPTASSFNPPVLAVDSTRLAAVANWPAGSDVAVAAAALAAPGPAPITVTATSVEIDATMDWSTSTLMQVALSAVFLPNDGGLEVDADFGLTSLGRHTYEAQVPSCAAGCRLVGLLVVPDTDFSATVGATIHSLRAAPAVGARGVDVPLGSSAAWRVVASAPGYATPVLSSGPDGLALSVPAADHYQDGVIVAPIAGPYPLPVVATSDATANAIAGVDGSTVQVRVADTTAVLPRVARRGELVDLNDLALAMVRPNTVLPAEVWLAPNAPDSVVDALQAQGLRVSSERTLADQRAYLSRQGPAVGIAFALTAAIALVLLAMACLALLLLVDRSERITELQALRTQGIAASTARRSLIVAHAGLLCAAAIIALLGGALAWLLTADRLPVFVDPKASGLTATNIPIGAMAIGVGAGAAVLAVIAVSGALAIARRLRASGRMSR